MSADSGAAGADEWMRIARKDWRRAERNLKDRDPEAAGFFLQQSLEKYLKAFLLKHNWKLRKIHELDALLDEAAKFKQDLETHRDLCERVSGYYMAERYPPSHRQIGRHRYKQMDMVLTYVPLHYLYIVRPTDLPHPFAHPRPHRSTQHRPAVFGNPNQVVLQIVFRVTRRPIYLHTDLLPQGFA